jgi:predicted aminopeptidase
MQAWRLQRQRHERFVELLLTARERLDALYRSDASEGEKRERKQYEFGVLKLAYGDLKREWNGYAGYDRWFERTLNNAHLVSAATYYGCVPQLQTRLAALGGDLGRFYEEAKELAKLSKEERTQRVCTEAPASEVAARQTSGPEPPP